MQTARVAVPFLFVHRCHSHPLVFEFFYEKFQDRGNFKMYFDPVKTGKRLKALRLSRGLAQEKMAEKLNIFFIFAAKHYERIELGKKSAP